MGYEMKMPGNSVAARLDRLPSSRFHKRLVALVGGGMFCDNFDIYHRGRRPRRISVDGVFDARAERVFRIGDVLRHVRRHVCGGYRCGSVRPTGDVSVEILRFLALHRWPAPSPPICIG